MCALLPLIHNWLLGLVAWFSLRVREVPGSIPGAALSMLLQLQLYASAIEPDNKHHSEHYDNNSNQMPQHLVAWASKSLYKTHQPVG